MPQAEEPCLYPLQVALTANQKLPAQRVPIDRDSDFLLTGIHGTSTGTYTINLRLPSGRMLSNNPVANANLVGTANQPTAIGPEPLYQATSVLTVDLVDTSGTGNTVELIFSGIRRFKS